MIEVIIAAVDNIELWILGVLIFGYIALTRGIDAFYADKCWLDDGDGGGDWGGGDGGGD